MVMRLDKVVPFGRTLDEYRLIFGLTEQELAGARILGVGDGPASFNAELTSRGGHVRSIDPLYVFSAAEIERRFHDCVDDVIDQVKATPESWVWKYHRSAEHLRANRTLAMHRFVEDFGNGAPCGRYIAAQLPALPFARGSFDLAVCSHFLFLYSEQFDASFHLAAVLEMLRVAHEVRIFPLLTLMQERSLHLHAVIEGVRGAGFAADIVRVEYELQPGGNEMLRVRRGTKSACPNDAAPLQLPISTGIHPLSFLRS